MNPLALLLLYLLLHRHSPSGVKADEYHDNQDVARYFQLGKTHHKLKLFDDRQFLEKISGEPEIYLQQFLGRNIS